MINREEVYVRLNNVFRDVFDDDNISVCDKTISTDIEGWDSLEHINLLVAVEEEFKIKFNMKEVTSMDNVGTMVDIILSRIGNKK